MGAVLGGGAAVGVRLLVEWVRDRRTPRVEPRAAALGPVVDPEPVPTPPAEPAPAPAPKRMEIVVRPDAALGGASATGDASDDDAPLRTSQRVILHVLGQGRIGPNELAPVGLSQAGIGAALGIRQSSLAKALARLVAAGVLKVGRRHVEHQVRRLKVYELTPLGETLARDLRRRTLRPTAPGAVRDVGPIRLGR